MTNLAPGSSYQAMGISEIVVSLNGTETQRLEIQRRLDAAKTQEERNKLGQFATPTALATEILACARSMLPPSAPVRFLDPALGTGAFYSALLHVFPPEQLESALGFEIDPHYGLEALSFWQETSLQLRLADFTLARPPDTESDKFNLVICNPPYVRHHHVGVSEKLRLQVAVKEALGRRLSGLAGLYCYFMLLSHRWMTDGGLAGWLIPSEFMDVNYGHEIKRYLLEEVTLLRIHRFNSDEVQFQDAMVSSAVVWFRKQHPSADHEVVFSFGGTLAEPAAERRVSRDLLQETRKWTGILGAGSKAQRHHVSKQEVGPTLSDLFTVKRGIATGANDFFVLTKEKASDLDLPWTLLKPILPSPRFLKVNEIQADSHGNPVLSPELFIINCNLPSEQVEAEYPALWRYLESGVERGINQRYLCAHRSPWYAQEYRPAPPLLCTYMGRQTAANGTPFRFILNHSKATAANVYLLLYPKPALETELTKYPDLLRSIWQKLNQLDPETLKGEGRVYGGGLHKLEPNELANAPIDGIASLVPALVSSLSKQLPLFAVIECAASRTPARADGNL